MNWYIMGFRKAFHFQGRARRKEYWYFFLINILILFCLNFVNVPILSSKRSVVRMFEIYAIIIFIPRLSLAVRRLHDLGKSGFWILVELIPLGSLYLFILFTNDSIPGTNKYGPSPKEQVEIVAYECNECGLIIPADNKVWKHCTLCGGSVNPVVEEEPTEIDEVSPLLDYVEPVTNMEEER